MSSSSLGRSGDSQPNYANMTKEQLLAVIEKLAVEVHHFNTFKDLVKSKSGQNNQTAQMQQTLLSQTIEIEKLKSEINNLQSAAKETKDNSEATAKLTTKLERQKEKYAKLKTAIEDNETCILNLNSKITSLQKDNQRLAQEKKTAELARDEAIAQAANLGKQASAAIGIEAKKSETITKLQGEKKDLIDQHGKDQEALNEKDREIQRLKDILSKKQDEEKQQSDAAAALNTTTTNLFTKLRRTINPLSRINSFNTATIGTLGLSLMFIALFLLSGPAGWSVLAIGATLVTLSAVSAYFNKAACGYDPVAATEQQLKNATSSAFLINQKGIRNNGHFPVQSTPLEAKPTDKILPIAPAVSPSPGNPFDNKSVTPPSLNPFS